MVSYQAVKVSLCMVNFSLGWQMGVSLPEVWRYRCDPWFRLSAQCMAQQKACGCHKYSQPQRPIFLKIDFIFSVQACHSWNVSTLTSFKKSKCFISDFISTVRWSNRPHGFALSCAQTTLRCLFLSNKWGEPRSLLLYYLSVYLTMLDLDSDQRQTKLARNDNTSTWKSQPFNHCLFDLFAILKCSWLGVISTCEDMWQ